MPTFMVENRKTGKLSKIEAKNRRTVRRTIEQANLGSIQECRIELMKNKTQVKRVQYQMASIRKANRLQK
ncbi:unnamed protein product [marine sediment metagenome]|uniref:Uncharacterized protein n=1 Tax=marine sediment metagenome TaxID=412755 RepID=X1C7I3_9ZZZZ